MQIISYFLCLFLQDTNCRLGGLQLHNLTGLILKVGKDKVLKPKSQVYINPSSNWATSLIIFLSQVGSKVRSSFTDFMPGNSFNLPSTSAGRLSAAGQLGDVNVITMPKSLSSDRFIS